MKKIYKNVDVSIRTVESNFFSQSLWFALHSQLVLNSLHTEIHI